MQIESVKRWHWCVIGTIVGCAVAAVSIWGGPEEKPSTETVHHPEFEGHLLYGGFQGAKVLNIRNISVHPYLQARNPYADNKLVQTDYITYEYDMYKPLRNGGYEERLGKVGQLIPFQKAANKGASVLGKDVTQLSARQYLEKLEEYMKKLDPKKYDKMTALKWNKRFIEEPKIAFAVYGGGGFVLIGLIWPTLLNLLMGAGLGREIKEKTMDISKYKGKSQPAKAKPTVTQDDMDRLEALEAQLEASLREGAHERVPTAAIATVEAPIKQLIGGSAATEHALPAPGKEKDFGADQGDFYPTEVHVKKK